MLLSRPGVRGVVELIVSWLLVPALLGAICVGCGLVVERLSGYRMPASLLPVAGLALLIVLGTALMVADETAELAGPACVAMALAGFSMAAVGRRVVPRSPWAPAAAAAVFAFYAAPVVLSGEATIAGYIKLDDTATWLAFSDHIAEHGRDLGALAPSTYEAALSMNIGDGYPVGAFVPLAIASSLTGVDAAWLIQPYMAGVAAMLALALWALASPLSPRGSRAAASVIGAIPALLIGYYLWGGLKEVLAAALLAGLAALVLPALEAKRPWRIVAAPALVGAAVIATLSGGGAIWLLPVAVGSGAVLIARLGATAGGARLALATLLVAVLSLPTLIAGGVEPPTSSPLDDADALGNLAAPLDPLQLAGIWANGDFRFRPADEIASDALALLACAMALATVLWAARRRALGLPLFVAGLLTGCLALAVAGSPWVEAKAYATASVAIPFAAVVGAGAVAARGHRALGGLGAMVIGAGVLWSYALAYQDVNLAPRAQLEELERIGELVDGAGPTLITDYSPYGARHFLRDGDPESISDLRRRVIPLANGEPVPKGESADTDRIDGKALSVYRSLVIRRSPTASRPPAPYELAWSGEHYELWQRPGGPGSTSERLALGSEFDPVGIPDCERVRRLASNAGELVAARRPGPIVIPLSRASYPSAWESGRALNAPRPGSAGTLAAQVEVAAGGKYELWLGGSVRSRAVAKIDGITIGEARHELNNDGAYVRLGSAALGSGSHSLEVEFEGADLAPGSDGIAEPIGPLVLSTANAAEAQLIRVRPPQAARRLCGRAWDWIEVARPGG